MTEKASNIQIAGDHYRKFAIQPSEFIQRNGLNWCEGNVVKYLCRHASKNGVQDLDKAIHYINLLKEWQYPQPEISKHPFDLVAEGKLPAGFGPFVPHKEKEAPPAREPLDLRLPSYALPCTRSEIRAKFREELVEWQSTARGSLDELLEAWDCIQIAQTYRQHGGADHHVESNAESALTKWYEEGRPVMKAKKITMIKLAARAKYSPADCARILADV